ncbi:MAG: hypothetical protein CK424_07110 [Legionella sp.]|nr:MAG: hypothetical protein CK424_07110 [Legionella sp.]
MIAHHIRLFRHVDSIPLTWALPKSWLSSKALVSEITGIKKQIDQSFKYYNMNPPAMVKYFKSLENAVKLADRLVDTPLEENDKIVIAEAYAQYATALREYEPFEVTKCTDALSKAKHFDSHNQLAQDLAFDLGFNDYFQEQEESSTKVKHP